MDRFSLDEIREDNYSKRTLLTGFSFNVDVSSLLFSSSTSSTIISSMDCLFRFALQILSNLANLNISLSVINSGICRVSIFFKNILLSV